MPLYDFRCAECGTTTERLAPIGTPGALCACGVLAPRVQVYAVRYRQPAAPRIDLGMVMAADAEVKDAYQRRGLTPPDLPGEGMRRANQRRREAGGTA